MSDIARKVGISLGMLAGLYKESGPIQHWDGDNLLGYWVDGVLVPPGEMPSDETSRSSWWAPLFSKKTTSAGCRKELVVSRQFEMTTGVWEGPIWYGPKCEFSWKRFPPLGFRCTGLKGQLNQPKSSRTMLSSVVHLHLITTRAK
eukprot:4023741-Pyramimonas_sp.AAC.2